MTDSRARARPRSLVSPSKGVSNQDPEETSEFKSQVLKPGK